MLAPAPIAARCHAFEVSAVTRRVPLFLCAIAASLALQRFAFAAESADIQAAAPLTLEHAVALALERTPQLQAQAAALDAAQTESVAAGRLPTPELIVGVDNLPVTGEDAWSFDRDFMTMRKVGVMQTFPSHRKREAQRERAAASVSVAESQVRQTRLEIARATAEAWVDAHAADLVMQSLLQLKPEVALQAESARAALASGRGSTVDALAAQSEVSELGDRLLEAQREVDAARAELTRWIGEDAQRALATAPAFRQLPASRETLLASLHRHASLLTFDAQKTLAQSEIDVALAEKRADWSAELVYGDRGAAFSDMISLEFRVGLPFFSRYRQDPQISARRANLAQLDAEREAEFRMHAAEVTSALAAWETASKRVALYETERLPLARQRSQAALATFQAGRIELTAVLASHVAEIEVQRGYAELVRELGQAWVFLRYLEIGQEPS
jgi:cobalt-zinc-cadmium efflux system outer membrane protein